MENGGRATISSSKAQRVKDAVARLEAAYPSAAAEGRVHGHAANMGNEDTLESEIEQLFEKTTKEARLDHVVFTAGDPLAIVPIQEVSFQQLKQLGMVRFFAPTLVAKTAMKYLEKSNTSSITLTTGSSSEKPIPGWSTIEGYMTGLQGLTKGLALDLKPIRVNIVSPGAVDTELWAPMSEEQKQKTFKEFSSKMTTGAVAQVVDVAEAYLYAMKDRNLSGSMISTNGGALVM